MSLLTALRRRPADTADTVLSHEQAHWLLLTLARLHRRAADPVLLAQRLVTPRVALAQLVDLARELDIVLEQDPGPGQPLRPSHDALAAGDIVFLAREVSAHPDGDAARVESGEVRPDPGREDPLPAVVLAVDDCRVLLVRPGQSPQTLKRSDLAGARRIARSRPAVATPHDPDDLDAGRPRFGWPWFAQALLQHRRLWRDVVIASLAIQLLALAVPLATQAVVDKVIVHRTESTLIALGAGLALVLVFSSLLGWLRQWLVLHTGNRVDAVLGSTVFAHLMRLPLRFFEARPTGVLTARLQGVEQVREFIAGAAVTLVLDLPLVLVFLAIMLWTSWQLSLVVVAALTLIVGLSLLVVPAFRRRLDAQFLAGARLQAFVTEHVAGAETVKTLQMESPVQRRHEELLATQLQTTLATRQLGNGFNVAATALEQAMTLAILFVGAWLAMTQRDFTIGMLVAFQMFAQRLSQPVLRTVGLWQQFQQTRIAVRRLADILDVPAEASSLVAAREAVARPDLVVEQLAFRHGEGRPWLFRGLDLRVPFGTRVALMGPSGCGKSTLAKLLLGLYPTADGRILLGGHDIRQLPVNALRRSFGVVPQETVLFSGSVIDNLTLGAPHASFEQVVAACRMAGVHEVIEALPEGYQTLLGERGVGLSGGQRQRLAIARALLKRPQILIFDEATANLDVETAMGLARTINALKGAVTLVFIAHQLPRGLELDQIVRLDALPGAGGSDAAAHPGDADLTPARPAPREEAAT